MSQFKFLRVSGPGMFWGKNVVSKEYFLSVVQAGDTLLNLEDMTYFDKDSNEWVPIEGDK